MWMMGAPAARPRASRRPISDSAGPTPASGRSPSTYSSCASMTTMAALAKRAGVGVAPASASKVFGAMGSPQAKSDSSRVIVKHVRPEMAPESILACCTRPMGKKQDTGEGALRCLVNSVASSHPIRVDGVVVGLPSLECADQNGADECECHANGQHIQLHDKINRHRSPLDQNADNLAEWGP